MVSLLLWLLVFAIVIYVVFYIIGMLGLPEQIRYIVCLILGVVFLVVILQRLGVFV